MANGKTVRIIPPRLLLDKTPDRFIHYVVGDVLIRGSKAREDTCVFVVYPYNHGWHAEFWSMGKDRLPQVEGVRAANGDHLHKTQQAALDYCADVWRWKCEGQEFDEKHPELLEAADGEG